MARYKWHVVTNKRVIALAVLGHYPLHKEAATDDNPYVRGGLATAYNTYFRLGGKCSKACQAWYDKHGKDKIAKEFKPELGHYTNRGQRRKRSIKENVNV